MSGKINSSIGSRTFNSTSNPNGPGQRTLEIPDESGYDSNELPPGMDPSEVRNPYARMPGQHPRAAPQPGQDGPQMNYGTPGPNGTESTPQRGQFIDPNYAQLRQEKRQGVRISAGAKERVEYLMNIGRRHVDVPIDGAVFTIQTLKSREMRESILAAASLPAVNQMFEARCQQLARALVKIDGQDIFQILGVNPAATDSVDMRLAVIEDLEENVITVLFSEFTKLNAQAAKDFAVSTPEEVKGVVEDLKK